MQHKLKPEQWPEIVLAGNATITLQSGKTGKHFTYKIKQHKEDKGLYFVRLLVGDNNERDYRYIGCYYAESRQFHPAKQWATICTASCPPSVRAIKFLFERLYNPPEQLIVYHEGKCARCGRPLTTPESIERGLGPECCKLGG